MATKDSGMSQSTQDSAQAATVQEAIGKGIAAAERGNRTEAYNIFRETVEVYPTTAEAWVWLGGTAPNLGEAQSAFEQARSLQPNNEEAALGIRWAKLRSEIQPDRAGAASEAPATSSAAAGKVWAGQEAPYPQPEETVKQTHPVSSATTVMCPNCGKANPSAEKFCLDCGQSLQPQATASTGFLVPQTEKSVRTLFGSTTQSRNVALIIGIVLLFLAALAYWYLTQAH